MTDFIDSRIARLSAEIERLSAGRDQYTQDAPKDKYIVGMSENNSGGYYWLDSKDYDGLVSVGWIDARNNEYGLPRTHKTFEAISEDHAIDLAKGEFEATTGQNADAIGCTCCGQPFNFSTSPYWLDDDEDDDA